MNTIISIKVQLILFFEREKLLQNSIIQGKNLTF